MAKQRVVIMSNYNISPSNNHGRGTHKGTYIADASTCIKTFIQQFKYG